jgi:hypothetical protein
LEAVDIIDHYIIMMTSWHLLRNHPIVDVTYSRLVLWHAEGEAANHAAARSS